MAEPPKRTNLYQWHVDHGARETLEAPHNPENNLADKVIIPNARFRRDIGTRLIDGELRKVEELGLFD